MLLLLGPFCVAAKRCCLDLWVCQSITEMVIDCIFWLCFISLFSISSARQENIYCTAAEMRWVSSRFLVIFSRLAHLQILLNLLGISHAETPWNKEIWEYTMSEITLKRREVDLLLVDPLEWEDWTWLADGQPVFKENEKGSNWNWEIKEKQQISNKSQLWHSLLLLLTGHSSDISKQL